MNWIKCTDYFPELDIPVLVWNTDAVEIARRANNWNQETAWLGNRMVLRNVTHWMPLPKSPKQIEESYSERKWCC